MATVVIMPRQGQSVETCIISTLDKQKGDTVKKGDILFTYETDKASFEEEAPVDGTVLEVFYNEGDEVPVLHNMMIIGEEGEDISALLADMKPAEEEAPQAEPKAEEQPEPAAPAAAPAPAASQEGGTSFASPRARGLANKEALPVDQLEGSGPGGRIIERDVQAALTDRPKMTALAKKIAAAEGTQPTTGTGLAGTARAADLGAATVYGGAEYEEKKLSNIRKLIARSMHASLQNSAQLTHHLGADARRLLSLRKEVKAAMNEGKITSNITINDMVCYAVVRALKQFPSVNAHFMGESVRYFNKVHLALAVDTDRGLMVPVVRNADDLSISGLSNQLTEVATACRTGSINPDLLASDAGTFTVSNLGNYGVEMFTPIINLPQAAILGVNTITPRPMDLGDGAYGFVPHIGLSLTYDHRALDGGEATRFLKQIAIEIENLNPDIF